MPKIISPTSPMVPVFLYVLTGTGLSEQRDMTYPLTRQNAAEAQAVKHFYIHHRHLQPALKQQLRTYRAPQFLGIKV